MRHHADGVVDVAQNGLAAVALVIHGREAHLRGAVQRVRQHVSAFRAEGHAGLRQIGAADGADLRKALQLGDDLLLMGRDPVLGPLNEFSAIFHGMIPLFLMMLP